MVAARRSDRFALSLLVVGALPSALATWWSVVTPVVAVLVLLLAHPAIGCSHPDGPAGELADVTDDPADVDREAGRGIHLRLASPQPSAGSCPVLAKWPV